MKGNSRQVAGRTFVIVITEIQRRREWHQLGAQHIPLWRPLLLSPCHWSAARVKTRATAARALLRVMIYDLKRGKGGRSGSSLEHSAGLSGVLVDALAGPYELGDITAAVRYTSTGCAVWKRCRKMTECFVFTGIYRRSINPRRIHERRKTASELKYLNKHTFHTIYKHIFWFLTSVGKEIVKNPHKIA